MKKKAKKNSPWANNGGAREGSGAKPKHGEPTKQTAFRIPLSIAQFLDTRESKVDFIVKAIKSTPEWKEHQG